MIEHAEIHLILLADDAASLDYSRYLSARGVTYYTIRGRNQIENILEIIPINGIIVDTHATKGHRHISEELFLKELSHLYPLIYTEIDPLTKKPRTTTKNGENPLGLDEFIFEKCAGVPRLMRTSQRKAFHFNIMLSEEPSFQGAIEKTCTYDVSDSGIFAITTASNWREGDSVFVVINELSQHIPIQGTIVRVIAWGTKPTVPPGISIRFDAILDSQQDELFRFLQG